MQKIQTLTALLLLVFGHDMFLKMQTFHRPPQAKSVIELFNGTFDHSDNVVARDRMVDATLAGNGKRTPIDEASWRDDGTTTKMDFTTGAAGTWLAGVSTAPRNIELTAEKFNSYLEHDGVFDMLEWRSTNDELDQDAVERYSKHAKILFQVGDELTGDWETVLGYPIEFVPLSNPYALSVGDELRLKLLWQGKPLAGQAVYVGSREDAHAHDDADHDHDHDHDHATNQHVTDARGEFVMKLEHAGPWFVRTIHMELSDEEGLTHESNWATLTFEVRNATGGDRAGASFLIIGGVVVLLAGLLVLVLRRR